jgi:hypothetical protein
MDNKPQPLHRLTVPIAVLAIAAAIAGGPRAVAAQDVGDSIRSEVDSLRVEIDSLRAALRRLEAERAEEEQRDELEALLEAAEEAAADVPPDDPQAQEGQFVGRQRSLQALNPEISVNADFFAFSNPDDPDDNNFVPREFEFSFQSSLDPYSRAKIFLAYHTPGGELIPFEGEEGHGHGEDGEEAGFELEEAYLEWVALPGGFSLKLGQFFQQLGTMNRWHSHALPFQTRSLPHLAFIGEENLSQAGASARVLLPIRGAGTYEAAVEVTRSSNALLYGESNKPSFLGHVNAFWQLGQAWDLDVGVSATGGPFRLDPAEEEEEPPTEPLDPIAFDQRLYAAEGSLTWTPPGRSLYRGFNLRGGVMVRDPSGLEGLETAWGTWVWGEYRLGRQWLVGGRYEWVQEPDDPDESAWLIAPTLTWWQSEWVRLRAEFDHLEDPAGVRNLFLIQFTFAMGPHKHETY